MARTTLHRWAPTMVGLAFAGIGLGAAGFAAQELSLSVTPPPDPSLEEVDPVDLLRDEVATLQGDVQGLGAGLGTSLEALATFLDEGAQARDAAQTQALRAELAAVGRRLDALEAEHQRLLERPVVAAAPRGQETTLAAAAGGAPGVEPVAEPTPLVAEPTPAVAEPTPTPPTPSEPEPAPRRGLFTVKLTSGLDFEQRLRFVVIPSLSRVGFDGRSTLHDFSGVTSEVEGEFVSQLAAPADTTHGAIRAQARTLRTGVEGRDETMWQLLEAETYPDVAFELTGFESAEVDAERHTVRGLALGTFTIRGAARQVKVPVTLEVDRSRRLVVEGEVEVKLTDFGIEPPSVAGAINMEDSIKLWMSLRLRSLGKAN